MTLPLSVVLAVNGGAVVIALIAVIVILRAARRYNLNTGDTPAQMVARNTILRALVLLLVLSTVVAFANLFLF